MKRILSMVLVCAALICLATSCIYEEKSDVIVTYSMSGVMSASSEKEIQEYLAARQTVKEAFVVALNESGLDYFGEDTWILRNQRSNDKAFKMAQDAGEKANSALGDFKAPSELNMKINLSSSFGDATVCMYLYGK